MQFTPLGLIEKNFLKSSCLSPGVTWAIALVVPLRMAHESRLALAPRIPQSEKIREISGLINILTFSLPWDRVSESRNWFVGS